MPEPLVAPMPEGLDLAGTYTIRLTALDPTTGAVVPDVAVSSLVLTVESLGADLDEPTPAPLPPPPPTPPPPTPTPPPPAPTPAPTPGVIMSDFATFVTDLEASYAYKSWCSANPGDCKTWVSYSSAILGGQVPATPTMQTEFGKALVDVGVLALDAAGTPPPAPTPTPPPPPPPAPAPAGTGLALIAYDGTLRTRPHLTDGTYDVVIGDWADAGVLAGVSGKGYAYTVTTAGVDPAKASQWVILDPLGNSGLAGALKPDAYIAKCAQLKAAHPNLHGIFLDNNEALGVSLSPPVPTAELVSIIAHVSDGLKAHGLRWLSNTGWYIHGDLGSNDGSIWRRWAQMIAPYFEYLLIENWQEASSHVPPVRRVRGTDAWWKHWDDFQKCVAAVPGQFMAATYEWGGNLMFGTYGRASMLLAPGADPRNVFYASVSNKLDPTGQPWLKRNPTPTINPDAGTATL